MALYKALLVFHCVMKAKLRIQRTLIITQ